MTDAYSGAHPKGKGPAEREVFLPEERFASKYDNSWQGKISRRLHSSNEYIRIFLAEFLGTLILVSLGVGSIAQVVLNQQNFRLNIIGINLGWGLAVASGVYVCGGVSGGHINPAVSVCFALFGRIKWRFLPIYLAAQYLGAFFGAMFVYLVYYDQLNLYDGGVRQGPFTVGFNATSAGIFATYPQHEGISTLQGFFDQMFATGILCLMALAITDDRNMQTAKGLVPLAIGLVVTALTTAFESNCGAALNPARDLGPRIFTAMAGWGGGVFSYRSYNWFWVPILGPHVGAILGGWLYNACVGLHMPYKTYSTPHA